MPAKLHMYNFRAGAPYLSQFRQPGMWKGAPEDTRPFRSKRTSPHRLESEQLPQPWAGGELVRHGQGLLPCHRSLLAETFSTLSSTPTSFRRGS